MNHPQSIAMKLENGIAVLGEYPVEGPGYAGALVAHDEHGRPVVEWTCEHRHGTREEAHLCSRAKWFEHHG